MPRETAIRGARILPRTAKGLFAVLMVSLTVGLVAPIRTDVLDTLSRNPTPQWEAELWWPTILHDGFLERRAFGREIVFTYGPWGFVLAGYHPATRDLALSIRILLVAISTLLLIDLVRRRSGGMLPAVLIGSVQLLVFHATWPDPFWSWLPFLMMLYVSELPDRRGSALFLVFVLGCTLLCLTKFTLFVSFGLVIAAVTMDDALERRVPVPLLVHVSGIALFWTLGGQTVTGMKEWLSSSLEVVAGYQEAMSLDTPALQLNPILPVLVGLITILTVDSARDLKRRGARSLWWRLVWAANGLALFRWGFVRADHFHTMPASGVLAALLVAWLGVTARDSGADRSRVPVALSLIPLLVVVSLGTRDGLTRDLPAAVKASATGLMQIAQWSESGRRDEARYREAIRRSVVLSWQDHPTQSIDGYPYPDPDVLSAGRAYTPRPVYVSYQANTAKLAAKNADDLENHPRDVIVFRIASIDGRLPSMEDGASWPQLLSDYRLEAECGPHLVLRHRPDSARQRRLRHAGTETGVLGDPVRLPTSAHPMFAAVDLDLSIRGRLLALLYKTPHLFITTTDEEGGERKHRFLRSPAQLPFLVSPLIESTIDFRDLTRDGTGSRVSELMIDAETPSGRKSFVSTYRIRYYELDSGLGESSSALGDAVFRDVTKALGGGCGPGADVR